MTRQRNLGPVLALAGGGIALAAAIAGFVIVGGPGDARARRMDDIVHSKVKTLVEVVQCAFDGAGAAPASIEAAASTRPAAGRANYNTATCGDINWGEPDMGVTNSDTPAVGEITYKAASAKRVIICTNYRTKSGSYIPAARPTGTPSYREIDEAHPAGLYCYDLDLVEARVYGRDSQSPASQ